MIGPSGIVSSLASRGYSLSLAPGFRVRVVGPPDGLQEAMQVVAEHKPAIVHELYRQIEADIEREAIQWVESLPPEAPAGPVCRCGARGHVDISIHDGATVRRDCAGCGRFQSFPLWYGSPN